MSLGDDGPRRVHFCCTGRDTHEPRALGEWYLDDQGTARPVPYNVRPDDENRRDDEQRLRQRAAEIGERARMLSLDVTCHDCPTRPSDHTWNVGQAHRARGFQRYKRNPEEMTRVVQGILARWDPVSWRVEFDVSKYWR